MAPLGVHIKHAGKIYDVKLDPDLPPSVFKEAIYHATGVPVDRMKVMVKGGVLKDESSWKKIGPKEEQTFMVIGAAGELPQPPTKPIVFLEDMDDAELAEALAKPVGLRNLGNTCYMNASLQALRAIPELQVALTAPSLQSATPLPASLRDLFTTMSRTTDSYAPVTFLSILRQVNPQFAEMNRSGQAAGMGMATGYAQQDAEECFGQVINTLRNVPGLKADGLSSGTSETAPMDVKKFVEQYLMGQMRRELRCDEAPEEQPSAMTENVLKIECNINISTNYMLAGIMNSLDQKVEKRSSTLGREAVYSQKSRLTRLPGYLVVHMVRFAWRQDILKKAKIMRRVKFPLEFDALDLVSEELKAKLLPASRKLKIIEKDRIERRNVRKRTKNVATTTSNTPAGTSETVATTDVDMGDSTVVVANDLPTTDAVPEQGKPVTGAELDDESTYRAREKHELDELINNDVRSDIGSSIAGLYDLVAIVTHKGAAADSGHYIGFVKKSVFHAPKGSLSSADPVGVNQPSGGISVSIDEDDEDWYKFDDDKVSIFPAEKLTTLEGGGEDSSAYILLYKSKTI